jgi:hypothetical protein
MMFLIEDGYQVEKCITFGQPKVTDQKGAEMCQHLPLLRIINSLLSDWVKTLIFRKLKGRGFVEIS